jgi:hypothetical protein
MFASLPFVNAQIVNVKRFYSLNGMTFLMFREHAESVAFNFVFVINGYENGCTFVSEYLNKFVVGVFSSVADEQVRATFIMHVVDLIKQLTDTLDVLILCFADNHVNVMINKIELLM